MIWHWIRAYENIFHSFVVDGHRCMQKFWGKFPKSHSASSFVALSTDNSDWQVKSISRCYFLNKKDRYSLPRQFENSPDSFFLFLWDKQIIVFFFNNIVEEIILVKIGLSAGFRCFKTGGGRLGVLGGNVGLAVGDEITYFLVFSFGEHGLPGLCFSHVLAIFSL